ncbi:MFS transporter [Pseudonocardia sp. NPDC046786]|uniref:MFS transporter n=1 Tax=Pseudonocardia sp. NPDC046786 TaxID=3155471 RepID=UPI0034077FE8
MAAARERLSAPARWLVAGATTHTLAETFYDLAMPLLVLALTGSPLLMATMFAVGYGAEFFVAILGGSLVDRFRRRTLLASVVLVEIVIMAAFCVISVIGEPPIWVLIAGAGVFDFMVRLYGVADIAALPEVVAVHNLPQVNGIMQSFASTAQTLGPLLAGWTIFLGSFGSVFLVSAVLLLILLASIRYARWEEAPIEECGRSPGRIVGHMWAGVRFTFDDPLYRWIAIWRGVLDFALGASVLMVVFFMSEVLRFQSWEIGAASALMASGGILGGAVFVSVERIVASNVLVAGSTIFMAVGFGLLTVSVNWVTVGLVLALVMLMLSILSRCLRVLLQTTVPSQYLGRVSATSQLITTLFGPLGVVIAAWASATGDVRIVFAVSGVALLILAAASRFGAMRTADWRVPGQASQPGSSRS